MTYEQAIFPEPCAPLGIRLEPFSVGHDLCLSAVDSPFIFGHKEPGLSDLLTALLVCSQRIIPNQNPAARELPFRWKLLSWQVKWASILRPEAIEQAVLQVRQYIASADACRPRINRDTSLSRPSTVPMLLAQERALMNHYHLSPDAVLNMPVAEAEWKYLAWLEHEGAITFATREDDDFMEWAKSEEVGEWVRQKMAEAGQKVGAN